MEWNLKGWLFVSPFIFLREKSERIRMISDSFTRQVCVSAAPQIPADKKAAQK